MDNRPAKPFLRYAVVWQGEIVARFKMLGHARSFAQRFSMARIVDVAEQIKEEGT